MKGDSARPGQLQSLVKLRPFVSTRNNVHLFQSFDYAIANPKAIAPYYDSVWGGTPENVRQFHQGNPAMIVSYYIPVRRDNGPFNDPQEARGTRDLAFWKHFHPDWIVYKCDGVTPAYEYGAKNMPLDFSNTEVVNWQIQTYGEPASEAGFDAIAADNLELDNVMGACGFYHHGKWIKRYSGQHNDAQWRADVLTWVSRMADGLHHLRHPLALITNLDTGGSPAQARPEIVGVVQHVDAILSERGFTNYGAGYVTDDKWLNTVNFMQYVQQQQRAFYLVNRIAQSRQSQQIQYSLASYLMGKGDMSYVYINTAENYGRDSRFSEANLRIGSPQGAMYFDQGVYWRKYSGGLVVVNPSSKQSFSVKTAQSGYSDAEGNAVKQSFTLKPHSGVVLMGRDGAKQQKRS